jgi:hypothetical protein
MLDHQLFFGTITYNKCSISRLKQHDFFLHFIRSISPIQSTVLRDCRQQTNNDQLKTFRRSTSCSECKIGIYVLNYNTRCVRVCKPPTRKKNLCFMHKLDTNIHTFFYNRQKNATFIHHYQVAKYVHMSFFDRSKIVVKKFPWML